MLLFHSINKIFVTVTKNVNSFPKKFSQKDERFLILSCQKHTHCHPSPENPSSNEEARKSSKVIEKTLRFRTIEAQKLF